MADGGLAAHLVRAASSELFGSSTVDDGSLHPDARLAAGGASATSAPSSPEARAVLDAYAAGVNDWIDDASRLTTLVRRRGFRARRDRRLRPRALDAARHARVAEGPGVAPRRELRQRDLPDARRRAARRPGPDRRAVPAIRPGDAGDHAERPIGGGGASARPDGRDLRRSRCRGRERRGRRSRPAQTAAWRRPRRRVGNPIRRWPVSTRRTAAVGDHEVGSNDWVVGPPKTDDGERAPRQRPAPRHRHAVGLVHQRAALPRGQRRRARGTSPA